MFVVGLTGGIASGKSSVAGILRAKGVPVLDADEVAREVVAPGTDGLRQLVATFGEEVLDEAGALDRGAMRRRIAADPVARRQLEAITHPAIRLTIAERLATLAAEGHPVAVVEAALMVETGSYRLYPALIVVGCDPQLQVERVMARDGVDEAEARAMLATQLPLADKEAVATHVIRNDGSLDALRARVDEVWAELTAVPTPEVPTRP
jgi:dephospho-CoA kinase